ncbi:ATP synthase complex assembly protein Atp25 [Schizosaccharomyces cryophilus OY26]|uniref:ATPase synthesis protein 25 n=1 Tax=Schizosaccharomyces cryophilus (strain OY26 / ATCC MYA-4695 / CBS 11777 / NBRC 106824 / NRRL Y48691) TaxID=653667 RepID=S9W0T4_SCHCR|nr:ATP synthase complex assembly protein Atp25 [Schizosaccharomyces cryophilus OY26]EPY53473.1 ATP synthase complex assembly protein Atp25 [Schizosaccharomyces cryophilus OY26]
MKKFPSCFRITPHFACRIHCCFVRRLPYRFISSNSDTSPPENAPLENKSSESIKPQEEVIRPWYVEYAERTFPKKNVYTPEVPALPEAAPDFLQEVLETLSQRYLVSDLKFIHPKANQLWSTSDLMLLGTCNDNTHVITVTRGISQTLKKMNIGAVHVQGLPNLSRQRILDRRALKRPESWRNKVSVQQTNWTCIQIENYNVVIHLFTKDARGYYQLENIDQDLHQILSDNYDSGELQSASFRPGNKKRITSGYSTFLGDKKQFHTFCSRNNSTASNNISSLQNLSDPLEEARGKYLGNDQTFSLDSFYHQAKKLLDSSSSQVSLPDINNLLTAVAVSTPQSINSLSLSKELVNQRIKFLTSLYTSIQKTSPIEITTLRRILSKCLLCSCIIETNNFHYLDPRIYKIERLMYRHGISMTVGSYLLILSIFAKYDRWNDVWLRWNKLTNFGILLDEDMYCHIFQLVAESKNERAAIYSLSNVFEDMLSQSPDLFASKNIAFYLSKCLDLISFKNDNSYPLVHKFIRASKAEVN